jgi:diguanylate cyclase (GGDEF)-like protein
LNIRDHSSQFSVFVFMTDVDLGASVKVHLSQVGYDAYYFQDQDTVLERLRENPPHILVVATKALNGVLSDFVSEVQKINSEIRFIVISSLDQFTTLAQYNTLGFEDVLSQESVALENRIVWSVDRVCEKLFLTYQNEQLYDDLLATKEKEQSEAQAVQTLQVDIEEHKKTAGIQVSLRLAEYRSAESKEEMIQKYLNLTSDFVCLYFKYLPSVQSFIATHASGVSASTIQGVGVQLDSSEVKLLEDQISLGLLPLRFTEMLREAFQYNPPKALPLYSHNMLEGVIVYSGHLAASQTQRLTEEFALFSLCYTNFILEKKVDSLEVQDFVTELYNRNYYFKVIEDEVQRSRRQKLPISVVKIAIDNFYELESSLGEFARDELLKSTATLTVKTSRSNDVTCRTAANEIALVLPNCTKKGAALRAERLRRIIEGAAFLDKGMRLTVSMGISEFPSLCDSGKTLDETSTKALIHIADRGGNKICLYKALESHKPEFLVPADQ